MNLLQAFTNVKVSPTSSAKRTPASPHQNLAFLGFAGPTRLRAAVQCRGQIETVAVANEDFPANFPAIIRVKAAVRFLKQRYLDRIATAWYRFRLLKLIVLCLAAALLAAGVVWLAERGAPATEYDTYPSTLRNIVVLLFSGWDIAPPQTNIGFWGAFAALLFGIIFVASVTAEIASVWVEQRIKSSGEVHSVKCSDHIVICNNSPHLRMAVDQLLDPQCGMEGPLVILADDVAPDIAALTSVLFVQGDPTDDDALRRAGVDRANVVIILATDLTNARASDSEVLLTVLAVEALNPDVYSVAQVVDSTNARHLERAGVDEVVSASELGAKLAVHASMRPGLSNFLDSLLTFDENGEFYTAPLPAEYAGMAADQLLGRLYADHRCTVIAVVRDGRMRMLPMVDGAIGAHDVIVFLAVSPPDFL